MQNYHLDNTKIKLFGPTSAQIDTCNQWAAVALDKFHTNSEADFDFELQGVSTKIKITWNSNFSKAAMKEETEMANHGGVALAWFVMSTLLDYSYVEQSEIGDGVDYRFKKSIPDDDDLNFMDDFHYVEISGILQESKNNTLKKRISTKHSQIKKGRQHDKPSSIIVTLFSHPKTIKKEHK
ncbi:MAG: hypothetical protein ACT6QS_00370 [Flavobacteriales bacterium]